MGVGGGFILVPAMIYLLGMSTQVVIGTSLMQILFVSITSTIMHAYINQTVDVILSGLLLLGGVLGVQMGAPICTPNTPPNNSNPDKITSTV